MYPLCEIRFFQKPSPIVSRSCIVIADSTGEELRTKFVLLSPGVSDYPEGIGIHFGISQRFHKGFISGINKRIWETLSHVF